MSKYKSAVEVNDVVHATLSIVHIEPACGAEAYIAEGREPKDVDCPHCLSIIYAEEAQDWLTEQGLGVWKFATDGDQFWVAAADHSEATAHMQSHLNGRYQITNIWRVTNLDLIDMVTGDPDDGEDVTPCSLRFLLLKALADDKTPPMIIAATDWLR